MYRFIFSDEGKGRFESLSSQDQQRIRKKLEHYKSVPHIEPYLKWLTNFKDATHRVRVWDMRVVLERISDTDFKVINVWHRGDIYK